MLSLHALTRQLLASATRWHDDAVGENEEELGALVPLAQQGIAASDELIDYIALAESPLFRRDVERLIAGGTVWGVTQVRSPATLLFRETPSSVVAFLAGSVPIASDPDSGACLVAAWNGTEQTSPVASFLFNDVSPADAEPGDFVLESASIRDYLSARGATDKRPEKTAGFAQSFARRYRRGIWIAQIVGDRWENGGEVDSPEEMARTVRDAAPLSLYQEERDLLASQPHLAAYWLLSHALLEETDCLADALARARGGENPAVSHLCETLQPPSTGPSALDQLLSEHQPSWTDEHRAAIRATWRRHG